MSLFSFIKNNLSILDLISEYVKLKQAGHYWKGSCPFHSETDASFTVSPDKQIFYCFGCHAHGDVISFMAKKENITQVEAAKLLIDHYGLEVPEEIARQSATTFTKAESKENYHKVCKAVALWCHQKLQHSRFALDYLQSRELDEQTIKLFSIGYLPGGNRKIKELVTDMAREGILLSDLIESNILAESKTGLYSPFEERILFPIRDSMGRHCGFGGRIFKPNDERPKYYNSREAEGFAKGKLLFGLNLAKKAIQTEQIAFLVEGYTDCISMAKHGYQNTVATLGTACTLDHLKILSRYTPLLYILYDGDQAGQKAIVRMAELCWEANLELRVITLPENHDPASFLDSGGNLKKLISDAQDIFSFFVESIGNNFLSKPLSQKLSLVDKITELLAKIKDQLKQDLLLQQASSIMQIPFQSLKSKTAWHARRSKRIESGRLVSPKSFQSAQEPPQEAQLSDEISLLEEKILSVILNNSLNENEETLKIEPDLVPYFSQKVQQLFQKLHVFLTNGGKTFSSFLETLPKAEQTWVIKVSLTLEKSASPELYNQLLFRFCKHHWKHIVRDLKSQMIAATEAQNTSRLTDLFNLFSKLKQGIQNRGLV